MNQEYYTTKPKKGQHLTKEERIEIQIRLKDGWNINQIAKSLGRSYNTIKNEIKRGTVYLYNGKVERYKAKKGQINYEENRKNKKKREKENKRKFGKSIDERPEKVEAREEFGHWEIDSVICKKDKREPVIVTILERKTRMYVCLKVKDHTSESLMKAIKEEFGNYKTNLNKIFKTITADNGTEFSELDTLSKEGIGIYFTHPYSSYEKGSNEVHNRILRRFIPKSKSINDYKAEEIKMIADIINNMPRKILGYNQPEELFDRELDLIYAA